MYLSRISLNRRRRGAMKLLGNRHAMHAAVMSSFPPGTETQADEGRVLWRIDQHDDSVELLIASPSKPCLVHIGEQAGWTTENTWATRDYSLLLDKLRSGDEYVFRVVANPSHTVTSDTGRKQVVGHVTNQHQRRWFLDKADKHGFAVIPSKADPDDVELLLRERDTTVFRRGSGRVTLVTAAFEGRLRVTDPEQLRYSLAHGIGRAKGYGCGLMTLLPLD